MTPQRQMRSYRDPEDQDT